MLREPHSYYNEGCKKYARKKIREITCPVMLMDGGQHPQLKICREILEPELKSAGIKVEYKIYPGHPHGFYWGNGAGPETIETMMSDVLGFLRQAVRVPPSPIAKQNIPAKERIEQSPGDSLKAAPEE